MESAFSASTSKFAEKEKRQVSEMKLRLAALGVETSPAAEADSVAAPMEIPQMGDLDLASDDGEFDETDEAEEFDYPDSFFANE